MFSEETLEKMGPLLINDELAEFTISLWLQTSGELLVELYRPHSGGGGVLYILTDMEQYHHMMNNTHPQAILFALRERQFPVRGIGGDSLLDETLGLIAEGEYFLIVSPDVYPKRLDILFDGNTVQKLREAFQNLKGIEIWVGKEPAMPDVYWKQNTVDNELIIVKQKQLLEAST